jgi:hypothetical protein
MGRMQGVGEYKDSKGGFYHGQFYHDQKKGIGKLTSKNGGTIFGYWQEGFCGMTTFQPEVIDNLENLQTMSFEEFKMKAAEFQIAHRLFKA